MRKQRAPSGRAELESQRSRTQSIFMISGLAIALLAFSPGGPTQDQTASPPLIRVTTDLVLLDVMVRDHKTGRAAHDLKPDNFEIFEDGLRQQITHFSQDQIPLSVILLLDVSGSMQPVIRELQAGALRALGHLKPKDEVAVVAFASRAQLMRTFTKDRELAADAIDRANEARVGRGTFTDVALNQAALIMERRAGQGTRRAIIVVTDDEGAVFESNRGPTQKGTINELLESGAAVSGLIVKSRGRARVTVALPFQGRGRVPRGGNIPRGRAASIRGREVRIKDYAAPTGGEVVQAGKDPVDTRLGALFDDLRSRYAIGYAPSNQNMDGKFRRVQIKLKLEEARKKEKLAVVTRKGYFARAKDPH